MNLAESAIGLLQEMGSGTMTSTAYDTAWVARLAVTGEEIGKRALTWLREHQLPDGSWGAPSPKYFHDRFLCTLAAAISLAKYNDPRDTDRIQRAKTALETGLKELAYESSIETIGFEVIVPTLFHEAEQLGLIQSDDYPNTQLITQQRAAKLATLPGGVISRQVTLAFSAEMVGTDQLSLLDIQNLQEANGSVGNGPSATAYFALTVSPNNAAALNYLREIPSSDGGMPNVYPFDIYEIGWVIWNLSLVRSLDSDLLAFYQPHLNFLQAAWTPGQGIGYATSFTPKDGDDTGLVFELLRRFNRSVDVEAVLSYEQLEFFRCFALESNPSISTNIHILGALRAAGFSPTHPSVTKVVQFLQGFQYWFDKWHVSPYYPTAHAIIAAAGYIDGLVEDAVSWILSTQNEDGSWGYYLPTAEETAYCLQALAIWKQHGHPVQAEVILRGMDWLSAHMEPPYPPLWIGKCLYTPLHVVRSTLLSAWGLALASANADLKIA
jgi:halimadienyl-diphosphate synthase